MTGRLLALRAFVRTAHSGSFSRAGRDLGLSQPSVSRILAQLEKEVGAALLIRTTRAVTLTDAGADYLARVEPLLIFAPHFWANYLRTLLIHGARAALGRVREKQDPRSLWLGKMRQRRHPNIVAVALANKNSRILAPKIESEDHTKDIDFSASGIRGRREAAYAATNRALQQKPWEGNHDPLEGFVLHELPLAIAASPSLTHPPRKPISNR